MGDTASRPWLQQQQQQHGCNIFVVFLVGAIALDAAFFGEQMGLSVH
jgi:hypothetical protein